MRHAAAVLLFVVLALSPPAASAAPRVAATQVQGRPAAARLPASQTPSRAAAPRMAAPQVIRPAVRSGDGIALGAFIPDFPATAGAIDGYAGLVGASPAIVMWYEDWAHHGFDPALMQAVAARGAMPLVTWDPWDWSGDPINQPAYSLSTIAAGSHDDYVRQWAQGAAAWGRPLYLRFAPEMNGVWAPWEAWVNGNTPGDYVAAWRHVVTVVRQQGATNVRWVWCPNVIASDALTFAPFYPGDAYVDWVGLDGYNGGTALLWGGWLSVSQIFGLSYGVLTALTSKPVMIGETASAEAGGDKAAWITQGLLTDLPAQFPTVRALVWFDAVKETDWRINSSPAALAAFRQVAASPLYQGSLP